MYKSLEDLMAGIYEMAAPDGIICNEVSKFLAAIAPEERLAFDVCKQSSPSSLRSSAFFEDSSDCIGA